MLIMGMEAIVARQRHKFISPGMEVRVASDRAAAWPLCLYAAAGAPGVVLGRGLGPDCWRVRFARLDHALPVRVLTLNEAELYRLAPRRPARRRFRGLQRPSLMSAPPGSLFAMIV